MNQDVLFGLVRHALTLGAGILVAKGYVTDSVSTDLIAGAMAVVGIGWSWLHKMQPAKSE